MITPLLERKRVSCTFPGQLLLTAARLSRRYRVPCRVRRWQGRHHLVVRADLR